MQDPYAFQHPVGRADRDADSARGRPKLAAKLHAAGDSATSAATEVDRAWAICGPRM